MLRHSMTTAEAAIKLLRRRQGRKLHRQLVQNAIPKKRSNGEFVNAGQPSL